MKSLTHPAVAKGGRLGLALLGGALLLAAVVLLLNVDTLEVHADPIPPEEGGYPKFNISVKTVTPTLASTGGVTLTYTIELRNTGAFTATGTTLIDLLPQGTTYNGDVQSDAFSCTPGSGTLNCLGEVGFDATAVVTFGVRVSPTFSSPPPLVNTVVISHPLMAGPVTKTVEAVITDVPLLTVEKSSVPAKPGAGKPLTYTLAVANWGQSATDLLVTVVDHVPLSTSLIYTGADGIASPAHDVITWTRSVTLGTGETTYFDFAVEVDEVPSGTVITNQDYSVSWLETELDEGDPYTVTVVTPIFQLFKEVWPDPPGSNREMTYQLTVLNSGSLATGLVITDVVPAGVDDQGGAYPSPGEVVSWTWPSLDTDESAEFTFTVYISDVMEVPIVNQEYGVCSAEEVCLMGEVLTSVVKGPNFETFVWHDPIAKKPGGGGGPVTPTLVVHNLGPGNAIDVQATLYFTRISVSDRDLLVIPTEFYTDFLVGPLCGDKCVSYIWQGDLGVGDVVTFTTDGGQSTIGGEEETVYTSTIVLVDTLANTTTVPFIGTADGRITHHANLVPTKSAPPVIGPGQLMTYTLHVWNSALSTDEPPSPFLTDSVPLSTTVVRISDGGISRTLTGTTIVSWTLPAISTGDDLYRSYTVRVDDDLISGTQIVNSDYWAYWHELDITTTMYLSNTGPAITTTVREVGLIDSYKEVTPTVVRPGSGNLLTYTLHIVNSGPYSLSDVTVYDLLPWEFSTYLRDAVPSAGELVSDIVSLHWTGSVEAFSSELITFTVLIDEDFQGAITNTAVISHADLTEEVVVGVVAYVTDKPAFAIAKRASPDPVESGEELSYEITVWNLGQRATGLVITDAIPINAAYVPGSANLQGELVDDELLRWSIPTMDTGESRTFRFRVTVGEGEQVINRLYGVQANGVLEMGPPVYTTIARGRRVYLPLVLRQ
jgi:uncharacterized repeat protein (TIGR01451 family)